jgi:hypothetical protein
MGLHFSFERYIFIPSTRVKLLSLLAHSVKLLDDLSKFGVIENVSIDSISLETVRVKGREVTTDSFHKFFGYEDLNKDLFDKLYDSLSKELKGWIIPSYTTITLRWIGKIAGEDWFGYLKIRGGRAALKRDRGDIELDVMEKVEGHEEDVLLSDLLVRDENEVKKLISWMSSFVYEIKEWERRTKVPTWPREHRGYEDFLAYMKPRSVFVASGERPLSMLSDNYGIASISDAYIIEPVLNVVKEVGKSESLSHKLLDLLKLYELLSKRPLKSRLKEAESEIRDAVKGHVKHVSPSSLILLNDKPLKDVALKIAEEVYYKRLEDLGVFKCVKLEELYRLLHS